MFTGKRDDSKDSDVSSGLSFPLCFIQMRVGESVKTQLSN